jgi:hypothetical protein
LEKYGFVYIWYDRKHKRFYVGKHWGNEDDGYICSSSWMKRAYKKRPQDFKRRILKTNINDKKLLLIEEFKWLQLIKKEELGKKYYNLKNCIFNEWQSDENKLLTVGEKISKSKIGNTYGKGRKGIKCTEKQKKILSESHKGQKAWNKGKKTGKQSEETIKKRTEALNRPEVKEKRSNAMKGKPAWNKGIKQTQKWFNNGIIEIFISFDEKPDDFILGRLKRK